jgi:hypothetical protein
VQKLAFFSGRGDALEKPSLPESTIQGSVVVPDSVAGARGPVGIRRPKRVGSGDSRLGSWMATVYRNSPLSGQPIMEHPGREWQSNPGYGHQSQHFGRELDEAARNQMRPIKRRMSKMTSINPRPPLG